MVPGFSARRAFLVVRSWPWMRVPAHQGLLGLHFLRVPREGAQALSHQLTAPLGQRERALGLECCQQSNIRSGAGLFITLGLALLYSLTISVL